LTSSQNFAIPQIVGELITLNCADVRTAWAIVLSGRQVNMRFQQLGYKAKMSFQLAVLWLSPSSNSMKYFCRAFRRFCNTFLTRAWPLSWRWCSYQ
jgi:hypothetical protein